jgi:phosphohistidine phosphatase SixA
MATTHNLLGFLFALAVTVLFAQGVSAQQMDRAMSPTSPEGAALLERLRQGGTVMFIRHADTSGQRCDTYSNEREGQRNISPAGRDQAVALGKRIATLDIPVAEPILAGPVFRARDTAELAFGADRVSVTDSLLADDYAGGQLKWVLSEHRRLISEPVRRRENRILVGHRGPVQMILGPMVAGTRLPEAGVLVLEPRGPAGIEVLGVLEIVPAIDDGNPSCRSG